MRTFVEVDFDRSDTRPQVAALLRRVADQIEDGFSAGVSPRFELHAPQIDAEWEEGEE